LHYITEIFLHAFQNVDMSDPKGSRLNLSSTFEIIRRFSEGAKYGTSMFKDVSPKWLFS